MHIMDGHSIQSTRIMLILYTCSYDTFHENETNIANSVTPLRLHFDRRNERNHVFFSSRCSCTIYRIGKANKDI